MNVTRLQEIDLLLDKNTELITSYTKRIAELIGSVRVLEKERDKLTKKNKSEKTVYCKDCVYLSRFDCPLAFIEKRTLEFAAVPPNFYCAKGKTHEP